MRILFFTVLVVLFFVSCKKNKRFSEPKHYSGAVSASKNGQLWDAFIFGGAYRHRNTFDIVIHKFVEPGVLRETLSMHNLPMAAGKHRVLKLKQFADTTNVFGLYSTMRADGDVPCDDYDIVEEDSAANFVNIETFNTATGEFKGTFSLKLVIQLPKCKADAPDTVKFTSGVFSSKIMN